jgi:hypothetical protein
VVVIDLAVTVGQHDRCASATDASAREADGIERGLVCPVRVLDDEQRGLRPAEDIHDGLHEPGTVTLPEARLEAGLLARHIPERGQRHGDEKVITGSPEHADLGRTGAHELGHEGALADPRLASHEHDLAACRRQGSDDLVEQPELRLTLQQHWTRR